MKWARNKELKRENAALNPEVGDEFLAFLLDHHQGSSKRAQIVSKLRC